MVTRGFKGRRSGDASRGPPGQSVVEGFPVLSIGPAPKLDLTAWRFFLKDGPRLIKIWDWESFCALEQTEKTVDIHCVTTWSKLDTVWRGVTIDTICADADIEPPTAYALAHAADDYSTNVPVADLLGGKAMIATHFGGSPLMRSMAARRVCWCHTCISGNRRSGSPACSSPNGMRRASGSCGVTICVGTRSSRNAMEGSDGQRPSNRLHAWGVSEMAGVMSAHSMHHMH